MPHVANPAQGVRTYSYEEDVTLRVGWLAWCPRNANRGLASHPACRVLQPGEPLTFLGLTPDDRRVVWVRDAAGVRWRVPCELLAASPPREEVDGAAT